MLHKSHALTKVRGVQPNFAHFGITIRLGLVEKAHAPHAAQRLVVIQATNAVTIRVGGYRDMAAAIGGTHAQGTHSADHEFQGSFDFLLGCSVATEKIRVKDDVEN